MADAADSKTEQAVPSENESNHSRQLRSDETREVAALDDSQTIRDPVETALAKALEGATAAGAWETVALLSRELQARREARAGVIDLEAARRAREGR